MKKYLKKISPKVCSGSGGFSTEEIMQGHKKIRDPKEGEERDILAQIQELNRRNQGMLPKPEPVPKKKKEEGPLTTLQQRKKKGPTGQWGGYE